MSLRQTVRQCRTKSSHAIESVTDCGNMTGVSRSIAAPPADMFRTVQAMPLFSKVIFPPLKTR
nr:hypothetical protein BDOA9_0156270 [Bradyrhizobium sp. DOA9]